VLLQGSRKLKKMDLVGTRTRDLPAFSIVPQLSTLPRAPCCKSRPMKLKRKLLLEIFVYFLSVRYESHRKRYIYLALCCSYSFCCNAISEPLPNSDKEETQTTRRSHNPSFNFQNKVSRLKDSFGRKAASPKPIDDVTT
jgi:hypothetical protein